MSKEGNSPRVGAGRFFIGFVVFLATVQGAGAVHDASDLHSENMSLVATLDTGHGGDMAFWGDTAVLSHGAVDGDPGNRNDGFRLVDISNPTQPGEITAFQCNSSGADVSVWRDLVFLSVNSHRNPEEPDCDAGPGSPPSDIFYGIDIVSVEDPDDPKRIHSVQTCSDILDRESCGRSHTHTLVPDLDHRDPATDRREPRLIVYVNSGAQTVVEVPLRDPTAAKVIGTVAFAPPPEHIAFQGGSCHDVSTFLPRNLAACAGGVTRQLQIWDISDPAEPSLVSVTTNPAWEVAHGAAFSWDGDTLIIADESVNNLLSDQCPGAGASAPQSALWFYDIRNPALPVLQGFYQLDQPVTTGGCTAHQFNVVPLRSGRDVLVAGWGIGGTTVVDFTDPTNPQQMAYYRARPEAAPDEPNHEEARSNAWSSYWYKGMVYANNMFLAIEDVKTERGFDVFAVDHPLIEDHIRLNRFNFGTQECLPRPHGEAHGTLSACTSPSM